MAFKDRLYDVPVVGTAMRVQDRYKEDAGDQFAGAIGFFGFLSLFPLILLALSVTGFVLADADDDEVRDVAVQIQESIPGFSAVLGGGDCDPAADATAAEGESAVDEECTTGVGEALDTIIENRQSGGIVGLVLLLLSGLRVVNAAQTATLVIFRVDRSELTGPLQKVRQVGALVALGLLALLGTAAGGAIGAVSQLDFLGVMNVLAPVLTTLGTFVLDVALFLAAYRLFGTKAGPPVRTLLPGAILGGLGWTLLKLVGSTYVADQVSKASELYGALGGVIGLMLLLYLAGRLFVYGAELSAVRAPNPEDPTETPEEAGTAAHLTDEDEAAAAATAGAPPAAAGAPLFTDHPANRPEPGTSTAEAAMLAPSASDATRARLATRPEPTHEPGQGRHALAFAVAVGAVAAIVGVLRPWDDD